MTHTGISGTFMLNCVFVRRDCIKNANASGSVEMLQIDLFSVDVSYDSFIKAGGYSQNNNHKVNNFLTAQPQ